MRKKMHYKILTTVFLCILSASTWAKEGFDKEAPEYEFTPKVTPAAEIAEKFGTSAVLNNGKKWRVVFYEGGLMPIIITTWKQRFGV